MAIRPEIRREEVESKEEIYNFNRENLEKSKEGNFSFRDYTISFQRAKEWEVIKNEVPEEILDLEEEDILRIGKSISKKTGIEKSVWRYVGPKTEPEEKISPERFLFNGLKGPLWKAAISGELRGKKREMADYIFGEVQDLIESGEMDWQAFCEVLEKAKEYGNILKEISKKEYEKILEEKERLKKETKKKLRLLREREEELMIAGKRKELEEVLDREEEIKEKILIWPNPIRYVMSWEKGKPKEEKFYTFSQTVRERKRGSFEALVYDEISGPILEAAFETSRRKKEERKWTKEIEKERKKLKRDIIKESLVHDLEILSALAKKNPEKAGRKAEVLKQKVAEYIGAKISVTLKDYKILIGKEEVLPEEINSKEPSLIEKTPEEGERVIEIRYNPEDIEILPPYDEGRVHFKKPIKKELILKERK